MIDHTGIAVSDFDRSKRFYELALKPLGYGFMMQVPGAPVGGFGELATQKPDFWIEQGASPTKSHIAFAAKSQAVVEQFHAAAIEAGGRDNGAPGLRPQYHPGYYAAFVLDPDGHNIEAVYHGH